MKKLLDKLEEIRNLEVHKTLSSLCDENTELYLVGGFIRDYLLGKDISQINDADYKIIGETNQQYGQKVADSFGCDFEMTPSWVVTFKIPDFMCVDFAFIPPNSTIEDALNRSDFSINAVALRLNGEMKIVDPYNGLGDIENRILRQINPDIYKHRPGTLMRAFRFKEIFGLDFEQETYSNFVNSFDLISGEKPSTLRHNLVFSCKEVNNSHQIFQEMFSTGFFFKAFPEFANAELAQTDINFYLKQLESTLNFIKELDDNFEKLPQHLVERLNREAKDAVPYSSMIKLAGLLSNLYKIKQDSSFNAIAKEIEVDKIACAIDLLSRVETSVLIQEYILNLYLCSSIMEDLEKADEGLESTVLKLSMLTGGLVKDAAFYNMCKKLAETDELQEREQILQKGLALIERVGN